MHFVIFGLTISSSWGNGHATLWRGLLKAMARRNHTVTFYERDAPYYSSTRDQWTIPPGVNHRLYDRFEEIRSEATIELGRADVAFATSYCPDGPAAAVLILDSRVPLRLYYDLDTPVTLDALNSGLPVDYLPAGGLAGFDLVLSYTGGRALSGLQDRLGARTVAPLYGWVDSETHAPTTPQADLRSTLSYLGTYAADRQPALEELFVRPARQLPHERFLIGGAQYPNDFPWLHNLFFLRHMPPALHPVFFCSSRATLNVTRRAMATYGFCPSGRLFEAAACGTPLLSDCWEGLESFFSPGEEILTVASAEDVVQALSLSDRELSLIAEAARDRTLTHHTAEHRLIELETLCQSLPRGQQTMALGA
jgi:spore maturation protein CgeB